MVQCTCGQQVEVPSVRKLRELETFQETAAAPARWNRRKGFRFLGSAISVVGIILALYVWLAWPVLYDAAAIAREIQSQPPFVAYLRLQSLEPPMPTPATERVESAPQLVPSKKLLMQVEGMGPQNLAPQQAYVAYEHLLTRHTLRQLLPFAGILIVVGGTILAIGLLSKGDGTPLRKGAPQRKRRNSQVAQRSGQAD